jgi:hypothetical protein
VELINWIWFAGAIASAATLGIADGKARNIQPIEALWLALLWVTETLLAAMQFGRNWHEAAVRKCPLLRRLWGPKRTSICAVDL